MAKERHREKERKRDRKGETPNHLSIHQWVRSAIFASHQLTSPTGFPFLKLPPPPCAVLLVQYHAKLHRFGQKSLWRHPIQTLPSPGTHLEFLQCLGSRHLKISSDGSFKRMYPSFKGAVARRSAPGLQTT